MQSQLPKNPLFEIIRTDQRWEFRPPPSTTKLATGLACAGGVFCVGLAGLLCWISERTFPDSVLGALFLIPAGVLFWAALRYYRHRRTPLIVERSGLIWFGSRELCAASAVEAILLNRLEATEDYYYTVSLVLADGRELALPRPYFGFHAEPTDARWMAEKLAKALSVEIAEKY